jgi:hypothetical protein
VTAWTAPVATPDAPADLDPLDILLLCDPQRRLAATVQAHIDALVRRSRHRIRPLQLLGDLPAGLDLGRFDAVIVHYSLVACSDHCISPAARAQIAAFFGLKALFIQDEYRHVDASIAAMRAMRIDLLFTNVPADEIHKVYPEAKLPGVTKISTLTGFVPEELARLAVPPLAERPIEVGYRARHLPAWLGALAREKMQIAKRFLADAPRYGLRCDISCREEDRLYGAHWIKFMTRCRAVLGVESGASVFDFTGDIRQQVEDHLARMPDAPFDELQRLYFAAEEGRIRLNQISPRCFEAAALRTLMILYEGEYSGILKPGRHYVPLRKDHSNMAEVVAVLRDPSRAQAIVDRAYTEVASNPRYGHAAFVAATDAHLGAAFRPAMRRALPAYDGRSFRAAARPSLRTRRRRLQRAVLMRLHRAVLGQLLHFLSDRDRDMVKARIGAAFHLLGRLASAIRR